MAERTEKILAVDDELLACENIRKFLAREGFKSDYATSGAEGVEKARQMRPEAVLLDVRMPGMDGIETLKQLKAMDPDCVVIMVTAVDEVEVALSAIRDGASDFLRKPVVFAELRHTIESALEKRRLVLENREYSRGLEIKVAERTVEIELTRDATIFALAKLAEYRDPETGGHLERIREYTRALAEQLRKSAAHAGVVDEQFVANIHKGSVLHDIGKVGIPDEILRKPGPLTADEFKIMKTHSTLGGRVLYEAEQRLLTVTNRSFLTMAKDIAFCHHEKWDGRGYPGGIKGEEIPLPARIMALADVYDALISKRCYKKPFTHEEARGIILDSAGKHFDPAVAEAFKEAESRFMAIKDSYRDESA
ncbi:MAG: response regulator [Nitrospinae bacterium]|nr:response regulator [Nitrospinota bacterium]